MTFVLTVAYSTSLLPTAKYLYSLSKALNVLWWSWKRTIGSLSTKTLIVLRGGSLRSRDGDGDGGDPTIAIC